MAKKGETKETEALATSTGGALAVPGDSGAIAAALEGIDVGDGGLGEVDEADFRLAAKIWNFKGEINGEAVSPTMFFDTIQESAKKELDLAFIDLHKTNLWAEFVDGKMVRRCSSSDRIVGVMEDGTERRCKGCPDAEWRQVDGKRTRRCGPVYNMIAMERDTQQPCVLRFKRTSLKAIQSHLQKHHIGKLVTGPGKRADVPLFSVAAKVTLKMTGEKVKYAVPVIERGEVLGRDEVASHAESRRFFRERILDVMAHAEKIDESSAEGAVGGGDDTSFEFGGNVSGGDKFVDAGDRMR